MPQAARTLAVGLAVVAAGVLIASLRVNPYLYFAGYVIFQYIVIATAWNILGGYAGYVNFGTPAFFALGAYPAVLAVTAARFIERSWIGRGLAALRDNEEAAECMGVPTLRLKLFATTISGFLLGVAGAPFPYYVTFVEPNSAFNLDYAVNALAMPMIGGTTSWIGPVIGAVLLGSAQQLATVTISSEMNLLIVGVVLVAFVVLAPEGIVCSVRRSRGQ